MRPSPTAALALAGLLLSACSFAPAYTPPTVPMAPQYKEGGVWTQATPAAALSRGDWWNVFQDARLDALEHQADGANPTLAGALARYDAARAYLSIAGGSEAPSVGFEASTSRNRQSDNRPLRGANQPDEYYANTIGLEIGYEFDLWGRIRNQVAAQRAETQAAAADLAAARLSLEAELAGAYVALRGLDAEAMLLAEKAKAYGRTVELIERRHADGLSSKLDLDRARTQLETSKAQISEIAGRRAVLEHAVAVLAGQAPSSFALPSQPGAIATPNVPAGLPSTLLQRRPDVAAAEQRMAAANAGIGVAKAAFFPSIVLDGSIGFQNTGGSGFLTDPNSFWGIGPNLLLSVFDNGRRKGQLQLARANFDQAAAAYKGKVLQAFQEVEDGLALENHLAAEAVDEDLAVKAAQEAEELATKRYRRGVISYLDLVTAQTAALQAEQAGFDLATRRSQACIKLIRAIGGGWTEDMQAVPGAPA